MGKIYNKITNRKHETNIKYNLSMTFSIEEFLFDEEQRKETNKFINFLISICLLLNCLKELT